MALVNLHMGFENILFEKSLSKSEKTRKLKKLARTAAYEGEVDFSEILAVLRVKRTTLRSWLGGQVYSCEFAKDGKITALTPGEAGLRLRCFDCAAFERGKCRGYGRGTSPNNVAELIAALEANGVFGRNEQARILEESYGKRLSAHDITKMMSRKRRGLVIPESALYMESG